MRLLVRACSLGGCDGCVTSRLAAAMNATLPRRRGVLEKRGFVQLFTEPHPQRRLFWSDSMGRCVDYNGISLSLAPVQHPAVASLRRRIVQSLRRFAMWRKCTLRSVFYYMRV